MKYKIKLKNKKIVGPYKKDELETFIKDGNYVNIDKVQVENAEEWKDVSSFEELKDIAPQIIDSNDEDGKTVILKTDMLNSEKTIINKSIKEIQQELNELDENSHAELIIPNKNYLKKIKEEEERVKTKKEEDEKKKKEDEFESPTRILTAGDLKNLNDIDVEEKVGNEEESEEEDDDDEDKIEEEKKKKRKKLIIIVIGIIAIYLLFFADGGNKEKKITLVVPQILFPISFEKESIEKRIKLYSKGVKEHKKQTFSSKIKASLIFREALENNFDKDKTLSKLFVTYAEIFSDVPNNKKQKAGNILFKISEISKTKLLKDSDTVYATALLYYNFDKHQAGIKIIENYMRVSKINVKLMSLYLKILVKIGVVDKGRKVFDKLKDLKNKKIDTYLSLYGFLIINENYTEAFELTNRALEKYPNSVPILLKYAEMLIYQENFIKLAKTLKKIKHNNAEGSRLYYSKYLEYYGVLSAVNKKYNLAAKIFKKALSINESHSLRSKLASVELGGEKNTSELILESKVINLITKSNISIKEGKWEQAFSYALEATDLAPNYIPARLLMSKIQITQGYFNKSIEILKALTKKHPNNLEINYALVEAYIASYKFNKAKEQLVTLIGLEQDKTADYASAWGKLFLKAKNDALAIRWLKKSINKNPLNDNDYYELAVLFLKNRHYKKGKDLLIKAISLDPTKVKYKTAYAKVLYELDDIDTAIGYLREVLLDNKDDPLVMGEIAIYYYKSGKISQYDEQKLKIEKLTEQNANLYSFLISIYELEKRNKDVIKYGRELLKRRPGDVETMMKIVKLSIEENNLKEAEDFLKEVQGRMEEYPKLNYYLSKINLFKNNLDEAIKYAETEIRNNPRLEHGYILLGDIYTNLKNFNKAKVNYKKAQRINPSSAEALVGSAWIDFKQGNIENALQLYLKSVKLSPEIPFLRKQLGDVYRVMGQGNLAIESYKLYLDMSPDAPDKDKVMSTIKALNY